MQVRGRVGAIDRYDRSVAFGTSHPADDPDLTLLLRQATAGDARAMAEAVPALYAELRSIAASQLRRERVDHTLQPTALVHEAWQRIAGQSDAGWRSREHFLAVAAHVMRRILVDHARATQREKRGGSDRRRVPLDDLGAEVARGEPGAVIDLHEALESLGAEHPDHASVVEMRFFGGMTHREIAVVRGTTERTVERTWQFARAWLHRRLSGASMEIGP